MATEENPLIGGKNVMIFGVFDGLHAGHKFFIENAKKYGLNLYIVVTPTKTVKNLKGKLPSYSIKERMHALEKEYIDARIVEGDTDQDMWTPIGKYKPNIIICGYDQIDLYDALEKIKKEYIFELVKIKENHKGEELHSRFINKSV